MTKHLLLAAAAATLALSTPSMAQTGTTTTTTESSGTVMLQPQQRTRIREYITTQRVAPAQLPSGVTVSVGTVLPQTVELRTFPAEIGVREYRYVVVGDRTVLVDPQSRRIVQVIE